MAKFQFRLATLLRLREIARDERRAHLGEALRADATLAQRLQELDDDLFALRATLVEAARPGLVAVDRLLDAQRYELLLRAERQVVVAQRQQLAEEIERRRETLVSADRDVRVLEKLRETQLERHRQEEERHEQQRLDEVAARRRMVEDRLG